MAILRFGVVSASAAQGSDERKCWIAPGESEKVKAAFLARFENLVEEDHSRMQRALWVLRAYWTTNGKKFQVVMYDRGTIDVRNPDPSDWDGTLDV